jgi:membrane protease YdiL (CAAX protease family)
MASWLPKRALAEALSVWAVCFGATLVAFQVWPPAAKVVATVGFLYLPLYASRARGEDWPEYGMAWRTLPQDLRQFLLVAAVVFPVFILGFVVFAQTWANLPLHWLAVLTPYGDAPRFEFRLPDRFAEWIIDDLFVVALPEEFFYRGYLQTRLRDAWPQGRLLGGARLGRAFWLTAVLFALGHLAIFQVWRLGVFFPALIFGWMRERSNSVVGAALFHAAANLLIKILEASYFGRL